MKFTQKDQATCLHRWSPISGGLFYRYECDECGATLRTEHGRMHMVRVAPGTKAAWPYYGKPE